MSNDLARALYREALDTDHAPPNLARYVLCDPRARTFYRNWQGVARDAVGSLRIEAARAPDDPDLADLLVELAARSPEFTRRWNAHDVEYYRSGTQSFHHPDVGDLDLDYDALEVAADPGLTIVTYTHSATGPHDAAFTRLQRLDAAP
ncbi:hypothetical protein [Streptomyces sp. NPDC095613]|uniref:MmyB family transcriptional regulator n=1 Tax=Streptomyces sp. NPDC095613 TaxID=3155540 RepID=UPI0033347B55